MNLTGWHAIKINYPSCNKQMTIAVSKDITQTPSNPLWMSIIALWITFSDSKKEFGFDVTPER